MECVNVCIRELAGVWHNQINVVINYLILDLRCQEEHFINSTTERKTTCKSSCKADLFLQMYYALTYP